MRIAMLLVYFGKKPAYADLFLQSIPGQCFDLLIFSDADFAGPVKSPNIHQTLFTLRDFNRLATEKLALQIQVERPYKVCDFKPAFGLIFEDYLKEFTFWGSIDPDMVIGNSGHFLNPGLLQSIDFYSGIKEYISGSFFLVRNNTHGNRLFSQSRDWEKVALSAAVYSFDECNMAWNELKRGESIFSVNTPIESMTEVVLKEAQKGLRAHFENSILEPRGFSPVTIQKNKVLLGKEYLALHFIYWKTRWRFYAGLTYRGHDYFMNNFGTFLKKPTKASLLFTKNYFRSVLVRMKNQMHKFQFILA